MSPGIPSGVPLPPAAVKRARKRTYHQLGLGPRGQGDERVLRRVHRADSRARSRGRARPDPEISAVVEFVDDPAPPAPIPEELQERLAEALREPFAAEEAIDLSLGAALPALLKELSIKASRDGFLTRTGLIRDELEHSTSALTQSRPSSLRSVEPERPFVQLCWLNDTIRTADPRSLTDVAGDDSIKLIDVPRRIEAEQGSPDVTLAAAWDVGDNERLSGHGITVAVIDSEVALRHPAFQDRVIHRRNYTTQPWGVPGPHGTAVAGIIGARHQEYSGVAPHVTIYNYKVLGTVRPFNSTDFDGALAIQQALEDGVRVANCSWGAGKAGNGTSREAKACNNAWLHGLTVVKSAGNDGPGASTLTRPADAEGVIVVGATDSTGREVASYSSRGPTANRRTRPHLVAPGGQRGDDLFGVQVSGRFGGISYGTSLAAPHVTGLLALLLERQPHLSPSQQRARLLAACVPLPGFGKNAQGEGLIDPATLLP